MRQNAGFASWTNKRWVIVGSLFAVTIVLLTILALLVLGDSFITGLLMGATVAMVCAVLYGLAAASPWGSRRPVRIVLALQVMVIVGALLVYVLSYRSELGPPSIAFGVFQGALIGFFSAVSDLTLGRRMRRRMQRSRDLR